MGSVNPKRFSGDTGEIHESESALAGRDAVFLESTVGPARFVASWAEVLVVGAAVPFVFDVVGGDGFVVGV